MHATQSEPSKTVVSFWTSPDTRAKARAIAKHLQTPIGDTYSLLVNAVYSELFPQDVPR